MIYAYATEQHYRDHMAPIVDAYPGEVTWITTPAECPQGSWIIVASRRDVQKCKQHRVIHVEHGAGQRYGMDAGGPEMSYPHVELFLAPRQEVADQTENLYPNAVRAVIGSPHVETLQKLRLAQKTRDEITNQQTSGVPVIAFHWDSTVAPEARSAFGHFQGILPRLRDTIPGLVGHFHPRQLNRIGPIYKQHGIPVERNWITLAATASLLIVDNSSIMWEAAALDIPIIVLNAPHYRRDVNYGLRFWDYANVGLQVNDPHQLPETVLLGLRDPTRYQAIRAKAARYVYGHIEGSTARAVAAVQHVVSG